MTGDKFHAHLDVCKQCENNPFALCPVGARALNEAMKDIERDLGLCPEAKAAPPRGENEET